MNDFAMKRKSIKDWGDDERPRERALRHGISSLSNAELLAILIGSGNSDESAVELSQRILASVKQNLHELSRLTLPDLMQHFKGIGQAKGLTILAAIELGRRRMAEESPQYFPIVTSKDVFKVFFPLVGDLPYEEFWIAVLNRSNKIIHKQKISQGGVAETIVDVKIILKVALEKLASGILLCHNHPSGNTRPSPADDKITGEINKAAHYCHIQLLDHLIISGTHFYSYADEGRLDILPT